MSKGLNGILRSLKLALVIAAAVVLAGCQSELYSNLSERQANQMVRVLSDAGITANRSGSEGRFSVHVDRSEFSRAISELSAKGLPRKDFGSLGQLFSSDKLVSTPFEERARFMHALNEELSDSISRISGVVSARVHLMVPESSPFEKVRIKPRASVFIYKPDDVDLSGLIPTVKNLVVNSVDNLEYENVEVALFSSSSAPATGPASYFRAGLLIDLLILAILGALVLFGIRFLRDAGNAPGKEDSTVPSRFLAPGE